MPPAELPDNNHGAFLFDFLGGNSDADFEILDDASQTGVRLRDIMPRVKVVAATGAIDRSWVGGVVRSTGVGVTFTTPASTDTTIPLGGTIRIVCEGAGAVTIAGGAGVTFVNDGADLIAGQGDKITLIRLTAGTYHITGT